MSCLADTNVLLRYVQQNHEMHQAAFGALDLLIRRGETVAIVPQSIAEFWNVCTRPSNQNGLAIGAVNTKSSGSIFLEPSRCLTRIGSGRSRHCPTCVLA